MLVVVRPRAASPAPAAPSGVLGDWRYLASAAGLSLLTRLVSLLAVLAGVVAQSLVNETGEVRPAGLGAMLLSFDGEWYRSIACDGYPAELPTDASGTVQQNSLAFLPLFPMAWRLLSTGGCDGWAVPVVLNLVAGVAAGVVLAALVGIDLGRRVGLLAATVWGLLPPAPVLLMAYTESLLCLQLFGLLLAARLRSYAVVCILLVTIGLTRPVALPVGAAVVGVLAWQWWRGTPRSPAGAVRVGAVAAVAAASVAAWPLWVRWHTGRWDALTETYAAWKVAPTFGVGWLPLSPDPYPFLALAALVVAAASLVVLRGRMRDPYFHAVQWAYLAYLFVGSQAASSAFRYLLPVAAVPVALACRVTTRRAWTLTIGLLVLAQLWWVQDLLVVEQVPTDPP